MINGNRLEEGIYIARQDGWVRDEWNVPHPCKISQYVVYDAVGLFLGIADDIESARKLQDDWCNNV